MKNKGFSLVEIILVVAILGILGAIVFPTFQNHVTNAKESAIKSNLLTIRNQIEMYKLQHTGIPPGYVNGVEVSVDSLVLQLTATSSVTGAVSSSTIPTDSYFYGPYVRKIPENPYNGLSSIAYVSAGTDFSATVAWVAEQLGLPGMPFEVALNASNKECSGSHDETQQNDSDASNAYPTRMWRMVY